MLPVLGVCYVLYVVCNLTHTWPVSFEVWFEWISPFWSEIAKLHLLSRFLMTSNLLKIFTVLSVSTDLLLSHQDQYWFAVEWPHWKCISLSSNTLIAVLFQHLSALQMQPQYLVKSRAIESDLGWHTLYSVTCYLQAGISLMWTSSHMCNHGGR